MSDNEVEKKFRFFSDIAKTSILIVSAIIGLTLYVHTTFATNHRVDLLENVQKTQRTDIDNQQKISCQIAIAVGVDKEKLPTLCQLIVK